MSETFAADGTTAAAVYPGGTTTPSGRSTISVAYDAASRSYTVGESRGAQAFRESDRVAAADTARAAVYRRSEDTVIDTLTLTKPGESGTFNYRYVGSGIWRRADTAGAIEQNRVNAFTYGVRSPDLDVPRTGNGSYAIAVTGLQGTDFGLLQFNGSGVMVVDFASAGFNGQGTTSFRAPTASGAFTLGGGNFTLSGQLGAGVNVFTGQLALNSLTTYTGSVDGRFYGPGATEIGATFAGLDAGGRQMAGNLLGRSGVEAPEVETMRNLFSNVSLQQLDSGVGYSRNADGTFSNAVQRGLTQSELLIDPVAQTIRSGSDVLSPANRVDAESTSRFTTYRISDQGNTRTYRVYSSASTNEELLLSYSSLGLEDIVNSDSGRIDRAFVFGIETLPDNIPRTGAGTYRGVLYGSAIASGTAADRYALTGQTSFSFDFSGSTFTGSMAPSASNQRTGVTTALGNYTFVNGTFGGSRGMSSAFNGDIAGVAGANGRLAGRFYGPTAQEVGGTFSLTTPGAGTTLIGAGAFAAKR